MSYKNELTVPGMGKWCFSE